MCGSCGCDDSTILTTHHHDELISIEQDVLAKNNRYADENKDFFKRRKILALNIMSSPGSGKTTLLAKTIKDLHPRVNAAVIVGDQQTDYDAIQLKASGAPALQVNTGKVCHLDAHTIGHALEKLPLKEQMILFIENIGNLVCPALFNLGENYKIVVLSVTEGDNKPLKYPDMFYSADLMIITKSDLLPYVDFNITQCIEYARQIKPGLEVLTLSATQEQGLHPWYTWLMQKQQCA